MEVERGRRVTQVLGGTPAVGEAVVGHVATVGHSQNKTTSTEYGVAHVFFGEGRHALWRWEAKTVSVMGLPFHQHGLSVHIDLDTSRVEATLYAEAFSGFDVSIASKAMNKKDAIE